MRVEAGKSRLGGLHVGGFGFLLLRGDDGVGRVHGSIVSGNCGMGLLTCRLSLPESLVRLCAIG